MRIDIWSDVVCPWCYIGKRRFEKALAGFPQAAEVEVVWHSFELDPQAPPSTDVPPAERLAAKYGMTLGQAHEANARVSALAAEEGLEYHLDEARTGNTFDAHRLIHLAARHGLAGRLKERLLRGYFTERVAIADPAALERLATEVGLDRDEVRPVLAGDAYAAEVRADEDLARSYGISGVPFFVLDNRFGVSGAQPTELFAQALRQAWAEHRPAGPVLTPAGPTGEGDSGR